MDAWFMAEVVRKLFRLYVLDVYHAARPQDKAYFRQSREARIQGTSLETFTADRAQHLHLACSPFKFGGCLKIQFRNR